MSADPSKPWLGILNLAGVAATQVGVAEAPRGSNSGAAVKRYQAASNLDGTGWPWCAAFVDWCVARLQENCMPAVQPFERPRTAAAFGLISWARGQKAAGVKVLDHTNECRVGDIVVYDFSHCGIVYAVASATKFKAVEGNTNDDGGREGYEVAIRDRTHGQVRAFIRLPALIISEGGKGAAAGSTAIAKVAAPKPSGSVHLTVPVLLGLVSLTFTKLFAVGLPKPESPEALGWLLLALAAIVHTLNGLLTFYKTHIKEQPTPSETYARKKDVDKELTRLESESKARAAVNATNIKNLADAQDKKHRENTEHLTEIETKIDRNLQAYQDHRADLVADIRHDVRGELVPMKAELTARAEDSEKEFRKLAGEIGALTNAKETTNQTLVGMRQTLDILLSRTAPNPRPSL